MLSAKINCKNMSQVFHKLCCKHDIMTKGYFDGFMNYLYSFNFEFVESHLSLPVVRTKDGIISQSFVQVFLKGAVEKTSIHMKSNNLIGQLP